MFDEAAETQGADRASARAAVEQLMSVMIARKRMYAARKPSIIGIFTPASIQKFLAEGVAGSTVVSDQPVSYTHLATPKSAASASSSSITRCSAT